jgi:hypothetical protein
LLLKSYAFPLIRSKSRNWLNGFFSHWQVESELALQFLTSVFIIISFAYVRIQLFGNETNKWKFGRAMAQAVSRRPPTAEARFRSRVSPCGICGGQSGTGTGFSPSTSVFPCQFHSTGAPLLGKRIKSNHRHRHLHNRVAQEASRLRCVRSVCCGALHHLKNKWKLRVWRS